MADKTWFKAVQQPMSTTQKKALLKRLSHENTLTSLKRPELLMDFLTDSLSTNDDLSIPILALSSIFTLITTRNLDYPHFYTRLYALLNSGGILHSKYRSRFIRHLEGFLSPVNHIPAATIASFIKRLSRLCLFAPPAAIIAIVPFIYNLLKEHPTCTFLLHRHPFPPYTKSDDPDTLGIDPFDPNESDPSATNAIDSSLWEIKSLMDHYNPTVAQIVRILGEQFTKQRYNVEDFLDHGYGTMIEGELKRKINPNREVVVEYRIPKRIFATDEEDERARDKELGPSEGKKRRINTLLDTWSFG